MDTNLTEKEWLARCANRFQEVAKVEEDFAMEAAKATYEALGDDLYNPEDAADDEMSYWSD